MDATVTSRQSATPLVGLEVSEGVATITLARPSLMNALDLAIALELERMVRDVSRMDDVRVVVLKGSGKGFCAGGDLASFVPFFDDMEKIVTPELNALHGMVLELRAMPKIVVTSVHGGAAGGGLSLALAGDLCVAADDARFTTAYRYLGVSPDVGGSHSLVQAIGTKRTAQLLFAEKNIDAATALDWGLVCRVFDSASFEADTQAFARKLAQENHARAIAETKHLIYRGFTAPLADQLAQEVRSLLVCMAEPSFAKSANAFLGK